MRAEKQFLTREYVERLNASPFFIVVDYRGLNVDQFTELRSRLRQAGAEVHVVKNSVFRMAAKEAGVADLTGTLAGQLAAVTGEQEIAVTAKVIKTFHSEFDKPILQFGYLGDQRVEKAQLEMLADLPSLDVLRAMLLGTLQAPASQLVRLLSTPATQLAQVLKARVEKEQDS